MRKLTIFAACAALAVGMNSTAMAGELDGASLYTAKACNTCHGEDGNSPMADIYPKVAGQTASYIAQQVKDIRDGNRANGMTATVMKPMVTSVTDEEIDAIAGWLATQ